MLKHYEILSFQASSALGKLKNFYEVSITIKFERPWQEAKAS